MLMAIASNMFAQSNLVATLLHNGEFKAYYSGSALVQAYNEAVAGDTIMLSSGTFQSINIDKSLTIIGSGMHTDSTKNIFPTKLVGDFRIGEFVTSISNVKFEGIYHNGIIIFGHTYHVDMHYTLTNLQFNKCRFYILKSDIELENRGNSATLKNVQFTNCKIVGDVDFGFTSSNVLFVNSIVTNADTESSKSFSMEFVNSIYIMNESDQSDLLSKVGNSNFTNSIIIADSLAGNLPTYANANRCVATLGCFGNIPDNTNSVVSGGYTDLFKTYTGSYSDFETFELTDAAKTKYLGTDGTEVGIYGGFYPFSPITTMPQITKFNVAKKSTSDGKLSVDIEVKAGESALEP